ncbi:hypothetical protein EDD85DRAFT_960234 [Armillaria nabsnona]|nr:hypothetical protein EDD85DRAFT_960234 [Armillaria nabsnona]
MVVDAASLIGYLTPELEVIDEILAEALSVPVIEHDDVYHVWVSPAAIGTKEAFYGCASDRCGHCGSVLGTNEHRFKKAIGGYMREEAIMTFYLFYIMENTNAPGSNSKANQREASA